MTPSIIHLDGILNRCIIFRLYISRQTDDKDGSPIRIIFCTGCTTVHINNTLHHVKTDSCMLIKQMGASIIRNAKTAVCHA